MYKNIVHQGMTIAEWCAIFKNEFTPYEIYVMVTEGANLRKLACVGE